MTTTFRIDRLRLTTTEGDVDYELGSDLTVLAGPTGVGKTTLLEAVKYGFGATARLAPVVLESVLSVSISVRVGAQRLQLTRSVGREAGESVRVIDLLTQERLPDHSVSLDRAPSINTLLLDALGFRDDMRAAAAKGSSKPGSRISFADILTYLYVPQYEINRDIAHSSESYREPKRRAVFELLFRLIDPEVLAIRSTINRLNGQVQDSDRQLHTVLDFLRGSGTAERADAEVRVEVAQTLEREAELELASLRDDIQIATDRQTRVLRDMLAEAERTAAQNRVDLDSARRDIASHAVERRRVQSDLDRLRRMREAGARLADIEFRVCPRCMQRLERAVPEDACRLCLQPDSVEISGAQNQYEMDQLEYELAEIDEQVGLLENHHSELIVAGQQRDELVKHLTSEIETRTSERITPRLQAFADATARLAAAKAEQDQMETTLRQWDRVADLEQAGNALKSERERLRVDVQRRLQAVESRRTEVIDELSAEFRSILEAIGIPGVQSAAIDSSNYLPVINGESFSRAVQIGGGVMTSVQVAYWSTLLAVALRRHDTEYPAFLMLDSPRLALNTASNLTASLYRRLVTQADANRGRVQFIIADNELPASYRGSFAQIDFDYPAPTIGNIPHPGPAAVVTIDGDQSAE